MNISPKFTLGLAALGLAIAQPVHAQTPGVTFTGGSLRTDYSGTLGYKFTTSTTIDVISLGYYVGNSSLTYNHDVAIFTTDGTNLVQATVPSGLHTQGSFAYVPVSYQLAPGTYIVAGDTGGTPGDFPASYGTTPDPFGDGATATGSDAVTFNNGVYYNDQADAAITGGNADGSHLEFPTSGGSNYVAANFQYAPEPSTVAAFAFTGLGVMGLMLKARKRNVLSS